MSVADTVEWDEHAAQVCTEVKDSGDGDVVDENVMPSIPVKAYFFYTRYHFHIFIVIVLYCMYPTYYNS